MTRSFQFSVDEDPSETAAGAWVAREAAEWTSEDEAALQAWLTAAPSHRQAFDAVSASMSFLEAQASAPEVLALRQRTTARTGGSRRALLVGSLAATLAIVVGALAYQARPAQLTTYETDSATRHVTLDDGSELTLDARTRLEVRLGPRSRDLRLLQGQASFDVAHDERRPFAVRLGRTVVVATGTEFNLEQSQNASTITLLEGSVDVRSVDGALLARLRPGDQYLARDGKRGQVATTDPDAALAWRSGKLIFDDTSLREAAARIERYAQRPLRVAPEVADLRISGAFDAGDEAAFIKAVEAYLPVLAAAGPDGAVELRRRPAS